MLLLSLRWWGAMIVQFTVSKKFAGAGDSWLKEQLKADWWGGLTLIGMMAAFIVLANIGHWMRG